jgi:hypothetical protein|tara:strand:+ start:117 stop:293 length:177 start_codon:yes stop_codon:yes gene_type:complete
MNTVKRLSLLVDSIYQVILGVERNPKPKRARKKGRYVADDKSTKDINEAWEGGKAPKK